MAGIWRRRHALPVALTIAGMLACAGCGSSGSPSDAQVIRGWARGLTAGNLDRAASYFALPALIANGTPPIRITRRAQARDFNELLPCGARVIATSRHGDYTFATFRLTDRVGGGCGAGIGALAATAFLIRHGKIVEWRMLPTPSGPQHVPGVPTPGSGQGPAV